MKKLILSAVFALACFTAQAENEVISNDDKNPKSSVETMRPGGCTASSSTVLDCPDGPTVVGAVRSSSNCFFAAILVEWALATATC